MNFRFRKHELLIIANLVNWSEGKTSRNRYKCDTISGTWIELRHLAAPSRWSDLNIMFGMHDSMLVELFYVTFNLYTTNSRNW